MAEPPNTPSANPEAVSAGSGPAGSDPEDNADGTEDISEIVSQIIEQVVAESETAATTLPPLIVYIAPGTIRLPSLIPHRMKKMALISLDFTKYRDLGADRIYRELFETIRFGTALATTEAAALRLLNEPGLKAVVITDTALETTTPPYSYHEYKSPFQYTPRLLRRIVKFVRRGGTALVAGPFGYMLGKARSTTGPKRAHIVSLDPFFAAFGLAWTGGWEDARKHTHLNTHPSSYVAANPAIRAPCYEAQAYRIKDVDHRDVWYSSTPSIETLKQDIMLSGDDDEKTGPTHVNSFPTDDVRYRRLKNAYKMLGAEEYARLESDIDAWFKFDGPDNILSPSAIETSAALSKVEKGRFGYIGDLDVTNANKPILITMLGLKSILGTE